MEGWGPGAVLLRFFLSALFGLMLGVVLLAGIWFYFSLWRGGEVTGLLWALLIGLPLLSGVLGIFWFEQVIDTLREGVEGAFSHRWDRWYRWRR